MLVSADSSSLRKREIETGKSIGELKTAIKNRRVKSAAGEDNNHSTFLINLGPSGVQSLLDMFNESFKTALVLELGKL